MWSILVDQRGAHLHLRPHGARPAPGLGALRRHGRPVPRRRHDLLLGRVARQSRLRRNSTSTARRAPLQAGGNMEGKEVRFGIANSTLWATATTDASNGSVNSMHDSYTPLGGLVPLVNIQLGEVIFGGVGSGPLRHARLRHRRHVRRRPDGRAHARISRQEARGEGGQDDHPRAPVPAAVDPRLDRARGGAAGGARRHRQYRPARLQRDPLRLHARAPATTAAPSPGSPPTRSSTTRRSASRC